MTYRVLGCQRGVQWASSTLVEKKNSLKLTETLTELEAALKAWDSGNPAELESGVAACGAGLSDERRKRAKELLQELRTQIEELSTKEPL